VASSELVEAVDTGETVLSLDGATLDQETVEAIAAAAAVPGAMPPSSVSRESGE
jgi:predicted acylesterase/phospholipase RssA